MRPTLAFFSRPATAKTGCAMAGWESAIVNPGNGILAVFDNLKEPPQESFHAPCAPYHEAPAGNNGDPAIPCRHVSRGGKRKLG
jgi:hypothetical protein